MTKEEKISRLEEFKKDVREYDEISSRLAERHTEELRSKINQGIPWVRQQVIEARCFATLTISPPPAVGGLVMRDIDPFAMLFERPYFQNLTSYVIDMIDHTIGYLRVMPELPQKDQDPGVTLGILKNYAFVAMPMDGGNLELDDVLDAIKEAASRCGVQAERVDEPHTNERITDRIVESIGKAEYVIVDLSHQKPNVYWEAGYAHGCGKTPIYIAKQGTRVEFDLKDYPVIFFANLKQLKDSLEKRIRGLKQ